MKLRYFRDTDTLIIDLRDARIAETRDLDQYTTVDLDADGGLCAITIEHASLRAGAPAFSFEEVGA